MFIFGIREKINAYYERKGDSFVSPAEVAVRYVPVLSYLYLCPQGLQSRKEKETMKGLIIQCNKFLSLDDRERIHHDIKSDLERDGFTVLDDHFTIYQFGDEEKEEACEK